jgi:hypothetical protein
MNSGNVALDHWLIRLADSISRRFAFKAPLRPPFLCVSKMFNVGFLVFSR